MKIIPYHAAYQAALPEISLAWLKQYDILEDLDVEMVNHPEQILDSGGHVLLAVNDTLSAAHPHKMCSAWSCSKTTAIPVRF